MGRIKVSCFGERPELNKKSSKIEKARYRWLRQKVEMELNYNLIFLQGEQDETFGGDFVFTIHGKELIVGELFVRIYNEQPTFPLEVGKSHTMKRKRKNLFKNLFPKKGFGYYWCKQAIDQLLIWLDSQETFASWFRWGRN